jgi:hypothetical protein
MFPAPRATKWRATSVDEILVEKITAKEGATDGRPWTRFAIKDAVGEWYSTFDGTIIADLKEGQKARIRYESKPLNGRVVKNLLAAEPVEEASGLPDTYRAERPTGEPDWDKKGLHMTRCALWNHFLSGHLASSIYMNLMLEQKQDPNTPRRDPMEHVLITGTRLVVHAERDVFERPAGDDGIPSEPPGGNGDIEI